jgi:hypothetical protein
MRRLCSVSRSAVLSSAPEAPLAHELERFAQEAGGTHRRVVDRFADFGVHHLHDGADQGPGCVVLTAVAAGVAHALDLFLIEHRELVLLGLGAQAQTIEAHR